MPSDQRFSYIMARTSYNLMRWCLLCSRPTRLVGFLVPDHWNNSLE